MLLPLGADDGLLSAESLQVCDAPEKGGEQGDNEDDHADRAARRK
jgi:hypothetical protein